MFTALDYNEMIAEMDDQIASCNMSIAWWTTADPVKWLPIYQERLKRFKQIRTVLMLERKEYYGIPIQE